MARSWSWGNSAINQAPVTGESIPDKAVETRVPGSTINETGGLIPGHRHGTDTTLARIIKRSSRPGAQAPTQRFVDRFATGVHAGRFHGGRGRGRC